MSSGGGTGGDGDGRKKGSREKRLKLKRTSEWNAERGRNSYGREGEAGEIKL